MPKIKTIITVTHVWKENLRHENGKVVWDCTESEVPITYYGKNKEEAESDYLSKYAYIMGPIKNIQEIVEPTTWEKIVRFFKSKRTQPCTKKETS